MATKVTDRPEESATRRTPMIVELYRSALGKKYVMAITGIIWMGYVLAHMVGNLKVYLGPESIDHYGDWLRTGLLTPIMPDTGTLWVLRVVLIVALIMHVVAAYQLTVMNRQARPDSYRAKRDYVAADFAARTMRWTGIIVLAFIIYHVADLTLGWTNPDFEHGLVYNNLVASLARPAVAVFYVVANLALGVHLYHGGWSLFQSMGWNHRRFNHLRRTFAIAFAVIVVVGNISFPLAIQLGIVS
ncbi:succinate dehydrogenase cytochrome b subunit [Nitriliruptor alkaliphilus]|uniref:succinate dehydrogenase cytochrome b subunit n=1 Tax=Nitriliruptor alkaliphilus TaxID=427918 RepID=UPI0006974B83|nr:succinate dehydrogenase cytochrome b subunit [Nitriliruptor alkaliphilus]